MTTDENEVLLEAMKHAAEKVDARRRSYVNPSNLPLFIEWAADHIRHDVLVLTALIRGSGGDTSFLEGTKIEDDLYLIASALRWSIHMIEASWRDFYTLATSDPSVVDNEAIANEDENYIPLTIADALLNARGWIERLTRGIQVLSGVEFSAEQVEEDKRLLDALATGASWLRANPDSDAALREATLSA